jgi:hypothetical protein
MSRSGYKLSIERSNESILNHARAKHKIATGIQRDVFYATGRRAMEPIGEQKGNARPFVARTRGYNVFTLFPLRIKRTSLVNNAAGQSPGMALTPNGREKARDSLQNGIGSSAWVSAADNKSVAFKSTNRRTSSSNCKPTRGCYSIEHDSLL